MAESAVPWTTFLTPPGFSRAPGVGMPDNRFTAEAMARHKREGLDLAVRARIWAMVAIGVFIPMITPWPAVLFYEAILVLFILLGLAQRRVGTVGHNRWELVLLFCDLALMTAACMLPNPLDERALPLGFQYRFETFIYFFTILAGATLSYSWQTIVAVGTWTAVLWAAGLGAVWYLQQDPDGIGAAARALFAEHPTLGEFADPTNVHVDLRVQEILVFLIVAVTLAVSMRRLQNLVLKQAEAERARANLSRYFSPNVVDSLSQNDDPLREIRSQNVAVLFVDIVGFTAYAAGRDPARVIGTLRDFHARMEAEVFAHQGTLDKYLGDGLMATFGTPVAGARDALNALECAVSMQAAVRSWNEERAGRGSVPIEARFGLHYGPVVLGDIGANRLEFAVIGNTVNVASRLEALTREHGVEVIASDALMAKARREGAEEPLVQRFSPMTSQQIRGLDAGIEVWSAG